MCVCVCVHGARSLTSMAMPYPHDLSGVRTQVTEGSTPYPHPTVGEACSPALTRHCLPAKPCCLLASLISGGQRSVLILNILRHAGKPVSKGGSTLPWSPSRSKEGFWPPFVSLMAELCPTSAQYGDGAQKQAIPGLKPVTTAELQV